jgi:hypothetical protein
MSTYYPKRVVIAKPQGKNIFEFVVQLDDKVGAYMELVSSISTHNADIRSGSLDRLDNSKDFLANFYCDMSKADCDAASLASFIRELHSVRKVDYADMSGKLIDRFLFPTTIFDGVRVLIMRVEPLLNIERELMKKFGSAGAAIMFDEGRAYATETMKQWRSVMPNASPQELLETVKDALRVFGWGIFEFTRIHDSFLVKVTDPPILKDADYVENRFYYGITSSILEYIYGIPLRLTKSSFDKKSDVLEFVLEGKSERK